MVIQPAEIPQRGHLSTSVTCQGTRSHRFSPFHSAGSLILPLSGLKNKAVEALKAIEALKAVEALEAIKIKESIFILVN
jgi:hypothetical protein